MLMAKVLKKIKVSRKLLRICTGLFVRRELLHPSRLTALTGGSMRKAIALVSSLLLVATLATPAQSAGAKYSVYQETLATFSSSATTLTTQQKAQVKATVEANPTAEKFICTGIRYYDQPMSVNITVRKRAKAACGYAKQLNPSLSTWFQNKPTKARSYAGKVLLTVKSSLAPELETSVLEGSLAVLNDPNKVWNAGQQAVIDALEGVSIGQVDVTYLTANDADVEAVAAIDRSLQIGMSLFGPRMAPGEIVVISYGHDSVQWSNDKMSSYMTGSVKWLEATRCYGGRELSVEIDGQWTYLLHNCVPKGEVDMNTLDGSVHAVTHFWQNYHANTGQLVPAWLLEGTATLYGDVLGYGMDDKINTKIFWGGQPHLRNALRGNDTAKVIQLMRTLEGRNVQGMAHVYTLGKMMLTGLSAAFGHDKIVHFNESFSTSEDFEANFVSSFGVPSQDFYEAMVPVLKSWALTK